MAYSAWIIWTVVAVVFIVSEIFISGLFIMWFGVGAIPAAIAAYIWPENIILQFAVYIVTTVVLLLSTRKIAHKLYQGGSKQKFGADRLLGRTGMVIETIDNDTGKGLLRVDHDEWRGQSKDGTVIEKGEKVSVLSIDGTRLIVRKPEQTVPATENKEA